MRILKAMLLLVECGGILNCMSRKHVRDVFAKEHLGGRTELSDYQRMCFQAFIFISSAQLIQPVW